MLFISSVVNGCFIAVGCEWILFNTWVFLLNCFLKCAAIISACSFSLMVNPPVSVLIRSTIFGFRRWISFITRNIVEESFSLFSISFRWFSNFFCLSPSSFGELFSWFHCDLFEGYFSWCYRLHCRFSVSFPIGVWIAERFCHLHGSDVLVSGSFIAWAISFHLLSLIFGRLRNFTSSSFLHWSATTLLFRLSRFTCALYFILGKKGYFILHDMITSLWSDGVIILLFEWALVILMNLCFLTRM